MTDKHTKLPERIYLITDNDLSVLQDAGRPRPELDTQEFIRADLVDERDALIRELVDALSNSQLALQYIQEDSVILKVSTFSQVTRAISKGVLCLEKARAILSHEVE